MQFKDYMFLHKHVSQFASKVDKNKNEFNSLSTYCEKL